jgi:hypothetical protein
MQIRVSERMPHNTKSTCSLFSLSPFWGICVESWLLCPLSKYKLSVKLLFKKEQVRNESFISHLSYVLRSSRKCSLLIFPFQCVETALELLRNHTYIYTNSVGVKYTYKCMCRFIIPNSQVCYVFFLLIIKGNSFPIHPG